MLVSMDDMHVSTLESRIKDLNQRGESTTMTQRMVRRWTVNDTAKIGFDDDWVRSIPLGLELDRSKNFNFDWIKLRLEYRSFDSGFVWPEWNNLGMALIIFWVRSNGGFKFSFKNRVFDFDRFVTVSGFGTR